MKKKISKIILKILLVLSFAPYVYCLCCGVYCFFNHFTFFNYTSYGLEAFKDGICFSGGLLCVYLVIPVCFIYQIIYFICKMRNRRQKRTSQGQSAVE